MRVYITRVCDRCHISYAVTEYDAIAGMVMASVASRKALNKHDDITRERVMMSRVILQPRMVSGQLCPNSASQGGSLSTPVSGRNATLYVDTHQLACLSRRSLRSSQAGMKLHYHSIKSVNSSSRARTQRSSWRTTFPWQRLPLLA